MISLHHKINEDLISVPFSDLLSFSSFQLFTKDWFATKKGTKEICQEWHKKEDKGKIRMNEIVVGHRHTHTHTPSLNSRLEDDTKKGQMKFHQSRH